MIGYKRILAGLALSLMSMVLYAQAPTVMVSTVSLQDFPLEVEALGNARANEAVDIRPKVTAMVTAIHFEEGQQVSAGDKLVTLENTEALAEVAATRANLLDYESQYKRSQDLYRTQAVSQSQLEQLGAQRDAALAAVAASEARLSDTVVKAPFAGHVGLRRISLGALVGPATIITTVDDTSQVKVDFDVPEIFMARLRPGLSVTARSVAWSDDQFSGEVVSINTRVDPISRTVTVRAVVPNDQGKLRAGMFLTVTLLKNDVRALMIPEQALVPERSEQYVYLLGEGDQVELRQVHTGRRRPGQVEILEGLAEGDRIVVEGTQRLRPGDQVRVMEYSQ